MVERKVGKMVCSKVEMSVNWMVGTKGMWMAQKMAERMVEPMVANWVVMKGNWMVVQMER